MTDPLALAEEHRLAQVRLAAKVQAASAVVFDRTLDPRRVDATFPVYAQRQTQLVQAGRQASHQLAAGYYQKARANSKTAGSPVAFPAVQLDREALTTSLRVTGPVSIKKSMTAGRSLVAATATARATAAAAIKRHTMNAGRDALIGASKRDGHSIGVARVSDGGPCPFCAMLVSRGPVYTSVASASFRPHDSCGCGYRVVFDKDSDGGWSPDASALEALWHTSGGELDAFARALRLAYADPESDVRAAFAAKARLLNPDAAVILEPGAAVTAPEAAFVARVRELAKELPEDRRLIGARELKVDEAMARAELVKEAEKRAGNTLKGFDDLLVQARTQEHLLRELLDAMDVTPGISGMTKWPPELVEKAKRAGVSRRQPKTVSKVIFQAIRDQESAIFRIEQKRNELEYVTAHIAKSPVPDFLLKPRLLDDLDELGDLGKETARQLAAVREAGGVVSDEIDRRLVAKGITKPDHDAYEAAQKHYDDALKRANDPAIYEARDWAEAERRSEAVKAAQRARDDALAASKAAAAKYRQEFGQVARDVLAEIRPMHRGDGITMKVTDAGPHTAAKLKDVLQKAQEVYPADWVAKAKKNFDGLDVAHVQRGYFSPLENKLRVSGDAAYLPRVAVHELGHGMEFTVPGLRGLEWAFHRTRTTKKVGGRWVQESTRDLYGNGKELSYFDEFLEPYTGKSYRDLPGGTVKAGAESFWEIFTTGVESVFESSPYVVSPAGRIDDDFRRFILGVMSVL